MQIPGRPCRFVVGEAEKQGRGVVASSVPDRCDPLALATPTDSSCEIVSWTVGRRCRMLGTGCIRDRWRCSRADVRCHRVTSTHQRKTRVNPLPARVSFSPLFPRAYFRVSLSRPSPRRRIVRESAQRQVLAVSPLASASSRRVLVCVLLAQYREYSRWQRRSPVESGFLRSATVLSCTVARASLWLIAHVVALDWINVSGDRGKRITRSVRTLLRRSIYDKFQDASSVRTKWRSSELLKVISFKEQWKWNGKSLRFHTTQISRIYRIFIKFRKIFLFFGRSCKIFIECRSCGVQVIQMEIKKMMIF